MRSRNIAFAALALTLALAGRADAAPSLGPSFFVADPRTDAEAFPAVAKTSAGYVVAWVAFAEAAFRSLHGDGTLSDPETTVFGRSGTDLPGFHSYTHASTPVELVAFGDHVLLDFVQSSHVASSPAGNYTTYSPSWLVIPGAFESSTPGTLGMSFYIETTLASAGRGTEWATLAWRYVSGFGPLELGLFMGSANGSGATTTLVSEPFLSGNPPPFTPAGVGIASDGAAYLAVWAEGAVLRLCPISGSGVAGTITNPAGWATSGSVRIASNGAGYIVAWIDASGALRVSPVAGDGTVGSASGIVVAGAATQVLDLDAAGGDYLVTYASAGDAGLRARGARVSSGGTVHDPDGFDLEATNEVAVTAVSDSLWFMVHADHRTINRTLLDGRFIGTVVPAAPVNPVPPPSPRPVPVVPDGGSGGDARVDGAASSARDGRAPSADAGSADSGGAPKTGTGGAGSTTRASGGAPQGSGGRAARGPTDAAASASNTGGDRGNSAAQVSGGCGCKVASRPADSHALGSLALMLTGLARRRRKRSR